MSTALYHRIDRALEEQGALVIESDGIRSALTDEFLDWLDDRVLADDMIVMLQRELPDWPPERLMHLAALVASQVRRP